jgi:site-specific DNA-methyltransferase (adenine-specific)
MSYKLINGNSKDKLKDIESNSIDCMITDPPYGYSFMGKEWDKALPDIEIFKETLRVLKPGAFAFVMSAPRSDVQSRMSILLEDAGFEIGFTPIYWTYSSGFPKAYNMGQSAEKKLTIGTARRPDRDLGNMNRNRWSGTHEGTLFSDTGGQIELTREESKKLEKAYGGFQPKPAVEVIIVAMKPKEKKTFVEQALDNNKGITWLDDCKIPDETTNENRFMSNLLVQDNKLGNNTKFFDLDAWWEKSIKNLPSEFQNSFPFLFVKKPNKQEKEEGLESLDKKIGGSYNGNVDSKNMNSLGANPARKPQLVSNNHPTVKPVELMTYLVALGTRNGDVILDPFNGSGTTGIACIIGNRQYIGIELDPEYYTISENRLNHWETKLKNSHKFFEFNS